jgi:ATP-binding cassette subfamily F protein uup
VVREYVGGYEDWVNQGGRLVSFMDEEKAAKAAAAPVVKAPAAAPAPAATAKPSFKQQKELDQITKEIEKLESRIATLSEAIADPGFYSQAQPLIDAKLKDLATLQAQLDALYARWETLV